MFIDPMRARGRRGAELIIQDLILVSFVTLVSFDQNNKLRFAPPLSRITTEEIH
jgi:hypothetical protein